MAKHSSIPVFILAGGTGTRLSEETHLRPKPMVEIGGIPILVHIMRRYYSFGFNDFVICAGYRSWDIKEYFMNYESRMNHIELDHRENPTRPSTVFGHSLGQERWRVRVIDTGVNAMTGSRVAKAFDIVSSNTPIQTFALTYGDGLSDANLDSEVEFHRKHGKIGTVLGVRPRARFGDLDVTPDGEVRQFVEKPQGKEGLINGGFFLLNKEFRRYLATDEDLILERAPLSSLAEDQQLMMYAHEGFWQPMDTLRDKEILQSLWASGEAPWIAPK